MNLLLRVMPGKKARPKGFYDFLVRCNAGRLTGPEDNGIYHIYTSRSRHDGVIEMLKIAADRYGFIPLSDEEEPQLSEYFFPA